MSRKRPYRSGQASAEHFQQCAEFALLCNRGLRALAVMVLPISLASRAAATACAAVQSTTPLFRRWQDCNAPSMTWNVPRPAMRQLRNVVPSSSNRTHAPSSLQNIRLNSDVTNLLSRSQNWRADGDGCVFALLNRFAATSALLLESA
jgi:hypothetical protein